MAKKPASVTLSAISASTGAPLSIEISSQEATARVWTIERRETEDGPASPIHLSWQEPLSAVQLWVYLMDRRTAGDQEWRPYPFLTAYPTAEGGPA